MSSTPKERLAVVLATACGVGYAPKAPGTFGSLPGLALGAACYLAPRALGCDEPLAYGVTALLLAVATAVGVWAIATMERATGIHDDQRIVVDEVLGQAIGVAFTAPAVLPLLIGFVAFRIFDITKPSLIGKIDRDVAGAWGTLGDDLLAGACAAPFAVLAGFMLK
jgi:phosphatidylglycerophosphatase A